MGGEFLGLIAYLPLPPQCKYFQWIDIHCFPDHNLSAIGQLTKVVIAQFNGSVTTTLLYSRILASPMLWKNNCHL
jgi:hypothetical protein